LLAKTYGTTFVGALALADAANVKLASGITGTGQAAMVARMQIASLVQGYASMGQPIGAVGADMTALAIQSGLASSQVSNLNSAWDQFQGNLTSGTGNLAGLATSLAQVGVKVADFKNNLGTASGISATVNQFAQSLKNFGTTGAAAWTNFDQVVGSTAPQLMDWLRTAGAEGAVSASQFKAAGLDMASALVPLAADSKTAQAEVMGLVQQFDPAIQTFAQLKSVIASSGSSFSGLSGIVGNATQKMANMQSVAETLGNVLNSALLSALSAATVQASGAGAAMQKYAQDLMASGSAASSTQGAYAGVMKSLENLGLSAQQAAALIAQVTSSIDAVPSSKTSTIYVNTVYTQAGAAANPSQYTRLPGHAAGTPAAAPGWAWVGEQGPELVRFRGGETVLPNSVSTGYAGGAGGFVNHVHVHLDGREIYSAVQKQSLGTQRRTGHNGMQRRSR
jgi:phage-related tail protein